jgi:SAM-dependent methyltransferase
MTRGSASYEPGGVRPTGWLWPEARGGTSRRLDGWADGYTTDTTYLDEINVDLSPASLSMVAVFNGQPPLPASSGLTWLDLACGTGLGPCSVAAGNPSVEVWGVDYNPAHIERARHLAKAAGLDNCRFLEASLEQVAGGTQPVPEEVDVVVVNGAYSWISAANQQHIVEVIGQRLRPGGLACVMYEAVPGWASMAPLAEALRLLVDADGRPGSQAFHGAAQQLVDLRSNGARYFPVGSRETGQMDLWATADGRYAAHEYLGAHFAPLLADEVIGALAGAKCSYLGGLGALEHHAYYSMPPGFGDLIGDLADPMARELVRDLVLQRALRRDLFRRGRASATADEERAWLHGLRIRGLGRRFVDEPFELPAFEVRLEPAFHSPLVEALDGGDLGIDSICAIHTDWSLGDATAAMGLLVAAGYAAPVSDDEPSGTAVDACHRLNDVLQAERRLGRPLGCVASPATGAMLGLDLVEVRALDAIREGIPPEPAPLVEFVESAFRAQGQVVREAGELVHDADAARPIIERRVGALLERGEALHRLGII